MNKKNFLCGLGAKLALAVVALTTVTFTSCEKEDFSIEVIKNPAKVTFNVDVLYINGTSMTPVDANVTFNGNASNVIEGTQAQPDLNTEVEIVAEYEGNRASKKVAVKQSANTVSTQNVTLIISATNLEVTYTEGQSVTSDPIWGAPQSHGHGYTHDGHVWNENANEYFVNIKGTYPVYNCVTFADADIVKTAEAANINQTMLNNTINGLKKESVTTGEYNFTVSAYCIFASYYTKVTTDRVYTITNKTNNVEIATINAKAITSNEAKLVEKEHPNHAGHYQQGHGHGHGDASNAGGGIIFAD